MAMVRYEPWSLLNQLHREMDSLFSRGLGGDEASVSDWAPAVDIKEEPDAYVLYADIPGVDPKDIEVHMENGVLILRGEREHVAEQERASYKRTERVRGTFFRRFSLPDTADAERIAARYNNGVLEVRIPKLEKVQPRRIVVEG